MSNLFNPIIFSHLHFLFYMIKIIQAILFSDSLANNNITIIFKWVAWQDQKILEKKFIQT